MTVYGKLCCCFCGIINLTLLLMLLLGQWTVYFQLTVIGVLAIFNLVVVLAHVVHCWPSLKERFNKLQR